ncbi:uncharacterized protein FIESC28_05375 [Fusarium coffeatum]|uniref:Uncharacterized protein n=1 Tax=Fusarium coffeatum TaxID=231269 RepID=A0A366RUH3_9HYPO|nr:uncharacterized protein FIESC28_05375 [Fusarium coffeatum]RBR20096.1 hypothetical protein FIESC28_05375 [Fusarium coffeatum]
MSAHNVHLEPEPLLLTPLSLESQQSQAFLPPTQDTDAGNTTSAAEQSPNDQDSAFVIRQAGGTCDSAGLSPEKENPAFIQWSLEILVLLFAGAIFMSICLILDHYDDEILPDWEDLYITLNTLISVLATIFRTAIAFVAFEILAQLKWEWLSNCFRPLYHAQAFDAASRGVYGSLRLIPTVARHEPFSVAAIAIAVLSLGIGSFTQQSIQTYQCLRKPSHDHDPAFIKIANIVDKYDLTDGWVSGGKPTLRMNLKTQVIIQDAFVNRVQAYNLAPLFKCSSGNCNFPNIASFTEDKEDKSYSHASLGICNSCFDIRSLVKGPMEYNETIDDVIDTRTIFELPFEIHNPWDGHGLRGKPRITGTNRDGWRVMTTTTVEDLTWAEGILTSEFLNLAQISVANLTVLTTSRSGCTHTDGNWSCPHDCGESTLEDDNICLPRNEDSYDPVAAICTLYPCLKYYNATVENARLQETVVQEVPLQLHGRGSLWEKLFDLRKPGNVSFAAIQQPCPVDGLRYTDKNITLRSDLDQDSVYEGASLVNTTAPPECLFEMSQSIWVSLCNELLLGLNSNCTSMSDRGVQCRVSRSEDEAGHPDNGIPSYPAHMAALYHNNNASIDSINNTLNALAERLTTAFRLDGKSIGLEEKAQVEGDLLETKICVKYVWQWLIFPGALLVSSTALLVAMVAKDTVAKKASIWKSSILPILLKDHPGTQNTGLDGLEEVAQGLEIKLQRGNSQ